ncbi:hypothetical protein CVS40_10334 [Lucilia cuprina]|nr:hypothetical protein CVS40_10334 [Lucilia cuprina]
MNIKLNIKHPRNYLFKHVSLIYLIQFSKHLLVIEYKTLANMSYLGNTSDLESEKMEFGRNRKTNIVSKLQAHKISSEPKWSNKHEDDSDSVSTNENFLTKGAFLLTPSYELSMERAALICEKMSFKGCFSLTKTASGILFKFSHPDDYQAVYKKGFHKVTGARFYRKIAIPCRPRKTFTLYVLDVPEDLPVEDIRHALYKFDSVVEVVRLHKYQHPTPIHFPEKNVDGMYMLIIKYVFFSGIIHI